MCPEFDFDLTLVGRLSRAARLNVGKRFLRVRKAMRPGPMLDGDVKAPCNLGNDVDQLAWNKDDLFGFVISHMSGDGFAGQCNLLRLLL